MLERCAIHKLLEVGVSGILCRPRPSPLRMCQTSPNSQLQKEHLGVNEHRRGSLPTVMSYIVMQYGTGLSNSLTFGK